MGRVALDKATDNGVLAGGADAQLVLAGDAPAFPDQYPPLVTFLRPSHPPDCPADRPVRVRSFRPEQLASIAHSHQALHPSRPFLPCHHGHQPVRIGGKHPTCLSNTADRELRRLTYTTWWVQSSKNTKQQEDGSQLNQSPGPNVPFIAPSGLLPTATGLRSGLATPPWIRLPGLPMNLTGGGTFHTV